MKKRAAKCCRRSRENNEGPSKDFLVPMRQMATFLTLVLLVSSACVGPDVQTDFDPSANFQKFRTYAFAELTDLNKGGILDNSLLRKRLDQMVGQQLRNKGLQQVAGSQIPDLLVHYWVGVQEKQQIQSTGPAGPGAYRWGGGYGGGVTTYEYKEGTLVLDLVEATKKELVWRATIIAVLGSSSEENMELANKAIKKAFEQYPPMKKAP
jgi:hypothetical protein